MVYQLPPIIQGKKIIPRNFGHIGHLFGSKMIDDQDKLISQEDYNKFTKKKHCTTDCVIVSEKIDGMNAGVVKVNGRLYPITRRGYDSRTIGIINKKAKPLGDGWAQWVLDHYEIYDDLLKEGERLVFENAMMTHTLRYKFKCEPVFLLAKYSSDNKRINYNSLCELAREYKMIMPPLLNMGCAIDPNAVICQYPKGIAGSKDGIEGVVYNYEHEGMHVQCAKFVVSPLIGTINRSEFCNNEYPQN